MAFGAYQAATGIN